MKKSRISAVLVWILIVFIVAGTVGCNTSSDKENASSVTETDNKVAGGVITEEIQQYKERLDDLKKETLTGDESRFEEWRISSKNDAFRECFEYIVKIDRSKSYTEEEFSTIKTRLSELYRSCFYFEPIKSKEGVFEGALLNVIAGLEERVWYYNTGNEAYMAVHTVKIDPVMQVINELKELYIDFIFGELSLDEANGGFDQIMNKLSLEDNVTYESISASIDHVANGYEEGKEKHFTEKLVTLLNKMYERLRELDGKLANKESAFAEMDEEEYTYQRNLRNIYSDIRLQLSELNENLKDGKVTLEEAVKEYRGCIDGSDRKYSSGDKSYYEPVQKEFLNEFYYDIEFVTAFIDSR